MLNSIADNVWAFALFVIAAAVAILAAHWGNKDLMTFAGTVAMTAAALFHGKGEKPTA